MKYCYSKTAMVLQWLLTVIYAVFLLILIYLNDQDLLKLRKLAFGLAGFLMFGFSLFAKEYLNRYIEFQSDSVKFNSFRFKNIKQRNTISFNVKYEDILNVSARRLPVIGIWGIKVTAKNLPHAITLSFCFCKHNEMYDNICKFAKQHNPNVYIDSRLTEFLERKKHD